MEEGIAGEKEICSRFGRFSLSLDFKLPAFNPLPPLYKISVGGYRTGHDGKS